MAHEPGSRVVNKEGRPLKGWRNKVIKLWGEPIGTDTIDLPEIPDRYCWGCRSSCCKKPKAWHQLGDPISTPVVVFRRGNGVMRIRSSVWFNV